MDRPQFDRFLSGNSLLQQLLAVLSGTASSSSASSGQQPASTPPASHPPLTLDELWNKCTRDDKVKGRIANAKTFAFICKLILEKNALMLTNLSNYDSTWDAKTFDTFFRSTGKGGDPQVFTFIQTHFSAHEMDRPQFDRFLSGNSLLQQLLAALSGTASSSSASSGQKPTKLNTHELSAFFAYCDLDENGNIDADEVLRILRMLKINPNSGDNAHYDQIAYIQDKLGTFTSFNYLAFEQMVKTWHENLVVAIKRILDAQSIFVREGWVFQGDRWINIAQNKKQVRHPGYQTILGVPGTTSISTQSTCYKFQSSLAIVYCDQGDPVQKFAREVFGLTRPEHLGLGRDVPPSSPWSQQYTTSGVTRSLQVKHIWRIESSHLWQMFSASVAKVTDDFAKLKVAKIKTASVTTLIEKKVGALGKLNDEINEKWLLHGTKFEIARSIIEEGFNERYASDGGIFGAGNYFGDTPEKTDQYTPPHDLVTIKDKILQDTLFPSSGPPRSNFLHYTLLCRVILGAPQEQTTSQYDGRECNTLYDNIKYHSIHAIPGHTNAVKRHHEYIQFHGNRIYPAYLIAYERHFNGAVAMC